MINASNMVTISGGLTRDPEYREDIGLMSFSIGVDNAGREGGQTASGFFDINVWTKDSKYSPVAVGEYILKAFRDGTLAKGSRVNVVGRLNHDRFETKSGDKASRVTITAENLLVVWSHNGEAKKRENAGGGNATSTASTSSESESDDGVVDTADDWVPTNF